MSNNVLVKNLHNSNNDKYKHMGVYIWKNTITGDQYVGSSVNLGRRIREHLRGVGSYKLHSTINTYGVQNFTLQFYILSVGYTKNDTIMFRNMLALEQYFLLTLNPTLNVLRTVDTLFTIDGTSPKSKPVYFYQKDVLIYSGISINAVAKELGLTVHILAGAIKRGSLYYQFKVTNSPIINNCNIHLISPNLLKTMIIAAKDKRYDPNEFMLLPFSTPVIVTDTETDKKYIVRSIKQAAKITEDLKRPVSKSTIRRNLMKNNSNVIKG